MGSCPPLLNDVARTGPIAGHLGGNDCRPALLCGHRHAVYHTFITVAAGVDERLGDHSLFLP